MRVSLKGASEQEFRRLTGARPEGFGLQVAALRNLLEAGVRTHPAVMVSFSTAESVEALRVRLSRIQPDFADFEAEELVLYGKVAKRLRRAGLPVAGEPNSRV